VSVSQFKYLGVIFDNNLNWRDHTNYLKSYLRCTLRKFYYLAKICSKSLLKTFYFAIFHSKLIYGITCWGGSYFNKLKPLLTLQKYVIRKICGRERNYPSHELFKGLSILPVRHLFFYKTLKTFYKSFQNLPFSSNRFYNLRYTNNVTVPAFRTTAYRNSYPVLSCRLFNKLPPEIKSLTSTNIFLKQVKNWLLNFSSSNIESLLNPNE